jgi:AAA15 family ATPase/GTPase
MLKLFEIAGFKNFRDTFTLDFSDVKKYEFQNDCISDGLIGKLIIYGKNAAGKSNFGLALFDIVSHLSENNVTPNLYDYYLNAQNQNGFAEFHYVFLFNGQLMDYRYRKDDKRSLIYECLRIDGKLLLEYDYVEKTGDTSGIEALAPTLNQSFQDVDSILRYVVNNTVLSKTHPLRQMMHFVSHMLWFRSLDENRYIGYKNKSDDYYEFIFKSSVLGEFEKFLHDSGVDGKLMVKKDTDGAKRLYFDFDKKLPFFKVASNGTKALYTFFYWYKTAKEISLLFVDEFDSFYHFELAEEIVKLLEKMADSQVILTSHNTNLMSTSIMRPDCYFILTRDKITSFANATTRELRQGHNLEKLYMSGEFNE